MHWNIIRVLNIINLLHYSACHLLSTIQLLLSTIKYTIQHIPMFTVRCTDNDQHFLLHFYNDD
jgi:hypothetical protein